MCAGFSARGRVQHDIISRLHELAGLYQELCFYSDSDAGRIQAQSIHGDCWLFCNIVVF